MRRLKYNLKKLRMRMMVKKKNMKLWKYKVEVLKIQRMKERIRVIS
jgi:hypothetical protein